MFLSCFSSQVLVLLECRNDKQLMRSLIACVSGGHVMLSQELATLMERGGAGSASCWQESKMAASPLCRHLWSLPTAFLERLLVGLKQERSIPLLPNEAKSARPE